jgi:radical SAM protein with 4Fe4S-binding SPASM domain
MALSDRGEALAASALPQIASLVEETSTNYDVRFIWQPPFARDKHLTVYDQILRGPRTSDDLSVRITSNGDVIPSRGLNTPAGNLFNDDWNTIWNNEVFVRYRERVQRPTRCDDCPDLAICAVDCPRKSIGWSDDSDGDF